MEIIPITEAKARIAELADRVAREHDHFMITRNGRADVILMSVAEYESMHETLDLLSDDGALGDLRQSREDFASGDTFSADEIRAELKRCRPGRGPRHRQVALVQIPTNSGYSCDHDDRSHAGAHL